MSISSGKDIFLFSYLSPNIKHEELKVRFSHLETVLNVVFKRPFFLVIVKIPFSIFFNNIKRFLIFLNIHIFPTNLFTEKQAKYGIMFDRK